MPTPGQVAQRANVTSQTIRNYAELYSELLSRQERRPGEPRLYTDEDSEVLCTIAALRRSGVPPDEIVHRIRDEQIPPFIDITPQKPSNVPLNPIEMAQDAHYPLQAVQPIYLRFDTIERNMDTYMAEVRAEFRHQRKFDVLWGMLLGAVVALVAGAFILFVLWLLVNGATLQEGVLQA